ncbi:MAG: site-2 protease family protein [Desulfobulbaceae bacterium]|jgi:Zn-dependent protease|nr:site-2 protease family protein [Desulfobulbaceae bacterium]
MFNIDPQQLIVQLPAFLFALTVHEFSHGYMAYMCGDSTAKFQGRLTLNPLKHLDPLGTIAIIFMPFGWAKPVPVDPRNFRNPQVDMMKVAAAGPTANIATMIVSFILLLIIFKMTGSMQQGTQGFIEPIIMMLMYSVLINAILAVFNLIPVPPLDGSKVLMGLLPFKQAQMIARLEGIGFIVLLVLLYMSGGFSTFAGFIQRFMITTLMALS